jgi:hypothetical protein
MTRRLLTSGQARQRRNNMKEMGKSILETMASAIDNNTLTVNVSDFQTCGSKGRIKVSVVASSDTTKSDILKSINEKFDGKIRAVARSFRIVESANADRNNVQFSLEGYVVPNVEIVSASSEQGAKMPQIAFGVKQAISFIVNRILKLARNSIASLVSARPLMLECVKPMDSQT